MPEFGQLQKELDEKYICTFGRAEMMEVDEIHRVYGITQHNDRLGSWALTRLSKRHGALRSTPDFYFFPASIASPFLHAMILIFGAVTVSFDSILNDAFFTRKVHTSSHNR